MENKGLNYSYLDTTLHRSGISSGEPGTETKG